MTLPLNPLPNGPLFCVSIPTSKIYCRCLPFLNIICLAYAKLDTQKDTIDPDIYVNGMASLGGHTYLDIVERLTYRLGTQSRHIDFTGAPKWEIPEKIIIGTAAYGVFIDKEQNPNQPVTPEECIKAFEPCIEMGAPGVHTHARGMKGGFYEPNKARTFLHSVLDPLRNKYGDKIVTDGGIGYYGKTMDENLFPVDEGLYEVVILNPSVGQMGDYVRVYSPKVVQDEVKYVQDRGKKVLIDIHDTTHIGNAQKWLVDTGVLQKPYFWHILGPVDGGFIHMPNLRAMVDGLLYLVDRIRDIDKDSIIYVSQSGRASTYLIALSILLGLHVRVGMEDTIWKWPHRDEKIKSNEEVVRAAIEIARYLGREPATSDDYRKMVGLKR